MYLELMELALVRLACLRLGQLHLRLGQRRFRLVEVAPRVGELRLQPHLRLEARERGVDLGELLREDLGEVRVQVEAAQAHVERVSLAPERLLVRPDESRDLIQLLA